MAFGSFFSGIKMIQLNPTTGFVVFHPLALFYPSANDNAASGDPIEGSYLYSHGGFFYLFVNWGTCCSGLQSTYNIRVGRSANITGPYVDRTGKSMTSSGGSLFLKATGKYIAPGQVGIIQENGSSYFGYHYLDANNNGVPTYDLEPLTWAADGWPSFTNDWSAAYHFQMDARDDNGEFYGLLQNGASIFHDPLLGDVLLLNGASQYVSLPGGAANAQTFAAVFNWSGGSAGQCVFNFGSNTNSYASLTPMSAATGFPRFTITSNSVAGEQHLDATNALPLNTWTHIAVTTDGTRGILYVNGAPVTTNTSMTLTVPDIVPSKVWYGRSQASTDPFFNGQVSSIRLFGRALSVRRRLLRRNRPSAPRRTAHISNRAKLFRLLVRPWTTPMFPCRPPT